MNATTRNFVAGLAASIVLLPRPAAAQSDNPANAGIQFDFSLPGARSLALGGAFVGVADDATAAWSNPAGLLALTRPEVSIEARGWQFSNSAVTNGHAFGSATGVGFDTVTGLQEGSFDSWTGAPSFLSFVYPTSRFAVAAYRHQLQRFKAEVASDGVFIRTTSPTPVFPGGAVDRAQPFRTDLEINVVNYGASAAVPLGRGLSVGLGIVVSDFSLESQTDLFTYVPFNNFNGAVPPANFTGTGQYYGPPDFSSGNVFTRTTETGDDVGFALTTGLIWRSDDGRASTGFAFRQGPTFDYDSRSVFGPGVRAANIPGISEGDIADTEEIRYAVPHVFSAGFGFRPVDRLLLSAEYDRVMYSRLSEETKEIYGVEEAPFPGEKEKGELIRRSLYFEDGNEFRFGAEYALVTSGATTFALRFGTWRDPDHRMNFDRENLSQAERASIARTDVRYLPGEANMHFTPGFGIAHPRFQIDGAVSLSDISTTVSVSAVVRF